MHGCVRYVGAGAPDLGSRHNLTVVGSSANKGQSHSYTVYFSHMRAMLTCYLLWAPKRGVPKQCFAMDALWEGGCPCAQALIRYFT